MFSPNLASLPARNLSMAENISCSYAMTRYLSTDERHERFLLGIKSEGSSCGASPP